MGPLNAVACVLTKDVDDRIELLELDLCPLEDRVAIQERDGCKQVDTRVHRYGQRQISAAQGNPAKRDAKQEESRNDRNGVRVEKMHCREDPCRGENRWPLAERP